MAVNSVTSTDPALVRERISDSLSAVSEREVVPVSDSATCKKALDAYNEALGSRGRGPTASTEVIVVRVWRDRYMVSDPGQRCGEWIYTMIMSGAFNVLRVIAT